MSLGTIRLRAWFAMTVCTIVTACTSVPEAPVGTDSAAFSRNGRFAITVTESDGQQQAVQGGFSWHDDGSRYRLDLTTPLGSIQARVEGRPGHATLTKADGAIFEARDPDALAEEALGGRSLCRICGTGCRGAYQMRQPQTCSVTRWVTLCRLSKTTGKHVCRATTRRGRGCWFCNVPSRDAEL